MTVLDLNKNAPFGENGTGILMVATDYDGTTYADGDGTNEKTAIEDIETKFSFADIGYFENFSQYIKKGESRVFETDYCGVGEIERKSEKINGFTADIQEILEMSNLALILNTELQTVAQATGQKGEEYIGMKRKVKTDNFLLFKFITCPDSDGLRKTYYFVKAALSGDLEIAEQNLTKNDFAGVGVDFEVVKGGNYFLKKETSPAL